MSQCQFRFFRMFVAEFQELTFSFLPDFSFRFFCFFWLRNKCRQCTSGQGPLETNGEVVQSRCILLNIMAEMFAGWLEAINTTSQERLYREFGVHLQLIHFTLSSWLSHVVAVVNSLCNRLVCLSVCSLDKQVYLF